MAERAPVTNSPPAPKLANWVAHLLWPPAPPGSEAAQVEGATEGPVPPGRDAAPAAAPRKGRAGTGLRGARPGARRCSLQPFLVGGARGRGGPGARVRRPCSTPAGSVAARAAVRAARAPAAPKLPAREPMSARRGGGHFLVGPAARSGRLGRPRGGAGRCAGRLCLRPLVRQPGVGAGPWRRSTEDETKRNFGAHGVPAGEALGRFFVRGLWVQPLQEARCRSRHPNRSNQVRKVLPGSPGRLGALRFLCHLAGQTRHVPSPSHSFEIRSTRMGVVSFVAFATGKGSFWIARGFRGFFKILFLKRSHPRFCNIVIRCSFPAGVMATSHWSFPGRQNHWSL